MRIIQIFWLAGLGLLSPLGVKAADAVEIKLEFTTQSVVQGKYAPRHVMAVWVADAQTNYVKTLLRLGQKRQNKLHTWNQARGSDDRVDGVTGATVAEHQTHRVLWKGDNAEGKPVPAGQYFLVIEFTENNRQGPLAHVPVQIGGPAGQVTVSDVAGFKEIKATVSSAAGK
ncbi:DUF2271 domain-containing protein [Fontisphaera persica]|uniref:DUF2271 domain-containing protein n=1 Tax=Fontisphaera persica TaxID=2974023 RepID=UPI0024BF2FB3|nr:DUF2271 domain-containing protein [Fontisphaera persica]WCJ58375.1 DUF2271 domain-containing protein [Fontisphaera persica]